jgi:hypothetical protein
MALEAGHELDGPLGDGGTEELELAWLEVDLRGAAFTYTELPDAGVRVEVAWPAGRLKLDVYPGRIDYQSLRVPPGEGYLRRLVVATYEPLRRRGIKLIRMEGLDADVSPAFDAVGFDVDAHGRGVAKVTTRSPMAAYARARRDA